MRVLNLLTSGNVGGIEVLCRDIAACAPFENVFCFLFGEGSIYEQMHAAGGRVYSLCPEKKISLSKFNQLKRIAQDCDIVVVHHDDPFLEMYYLALMRCYPRKKYVSMVHHCYDLISDNINYGAVKRTIKHGIVSRMFQKSDRLIFVSEAGRASYRGAFAFDEKKSSVVYNGISEELLEKGRAVRKQAGGTIRLMYVGRLVELKGVGVLMDVLPELMREYDIRVDIVGDGVCRKDLENRAREHGIGDRVTFHGFRSNVAEYLAQADIFVYPSRTEIFGISLVEAMAFGCICAANHVGGIPEIISDGYNGCLNAANSPEGLKETVRRAVQTVLDGPRREAMMKAAAETAAQFSIRNTIDNLKEVYESLLEG